MRIIVNFLLSLEHLVVNFDCIAKSAACNYLSDAVCCTTRTNVKPFFSLAPGALPLAYLPSPSLSLA